jgi:hypothetical protein
MLCNELRGQAWLLNMNVMARLWLGVARYFKSNGWTWQANRQVWSSLGGRYRPAQERIKCLFALIVSQVKETMIGIMYKACGNIFIFQRAYTLTQRLHCLS